MKLDIYGIGNPLIDLIILVDEEDLRVLGVSKGTMHLVSLEERERILKHVDQYRKTYLCGGSCPNTMIALSAFGVDSCLAGKVGEDDFGHKYINQMHTYNVVSDITITAGPTGTSIILVTPDTERTMNTYLGVNRDFSHVDINTDYLKAADFFYFTGYMWDTDLQKEAILKAIDICKKENITIIFDVADPFAVNRNRDEFTNLIHNHADIVFANREEAKLLFQIDDPKDAVQLLSEITSVGIVKNGSEGSYIQRKSELFHIPVNKVIPIDTTGAGDMYAAGFIYGLTKRKSLEKSGICASYLASQIVSQRGAQFRITKQKELKQILDRNQWDFT